MIPEIFKEKMNRLKNSSSEQDIKTKENILVLADKTAGAKTAFLWLSKNFERLAHQKIGTPGADSTYADLELLKIACFYSYKSSEPWSRKVICFYRLHGYSKDGSDFEETTDAFFKKINHRIKEEKLLLNLQKVTQTLGQGYRDNSSLFSRLPKEIIKEIAFFSRESSSITKIQADALMEQNLAKPTFTKS